MDFELYWEYGFWPTDHHSEEDMGTPADIQKLIQRAQRAQKLTDRAAAEGEGAEVVMNNFEQTLNRFNANFEGIKEYDKQIQAMLGAESNGGPPLSETFPAPGTATEPQSEPAQAAQVVKTEIDHATGDPIKT